MFGFRSKKLTLEDIEKALKPRFDKLDKQFERVILAYQVNAGKVVKIMATLDQLVAAAQAEDTKIDSLIALTNELKAKIDAIPGITPEQQAQIDEAFAAISDNPERIQAAIDANTPATPPVEPSEG